VTGTETVDDASACSDGNDVGGHLGFIRPHYYDSLDDSAEKPAVPSVASDFVKMEPSSSNAAVYNSVAVKLMVCLIILVNLTKSL